MQVTSLSTTYTTQPSIKVSEEPNTPLQQYLQRINWETTKFTNSKLETMLAASCLRFLAGLSDIEFVSGLSQEIHRKYKTTMKLSLWYSTEILNTLSDMYHNSDAEENLYELVNDAQEMITKRRYKEVTHLAD